MPRGVTVSRFYGYPRAIRAILQTKRYWLPIAAGFGCLIVALSASATIGLVLLIAGFGLILDGATALFARSGDATDHRQ